jgi:hypothetical protein
VTGVDITGPGFLNITLDGSAASRPSRRRDSAARWRYGFVDEPNGDLVQLHHARDLRAASPVKPSPGSFAPRAPSSVRPARSSPTRSRGQPSSGSPSRRPAPVLDLGATSAAPPSRRQRTARAGPRPAGPHPLGRDAARWALLHPASHDRPRITADHLVQRETNPLFRVRYAHARTRALSRNAADLGFTSPPATYSRQRRPSRPADTPRRRPRRPPAHPRHRAPATAPPTVLARHLVSTADAMLAFQPPCFRWVTRNPRPPTVPGSRSPKPPGRCWPAACPCSASTHPNISEHRRTRTEKAHTDMSRSAHPAGPRHADVLPEGHYSAPPADLNALDPKVWAQTVTRTRDGVVSVGGIDVKTLAEEFGTPAYFVDEADFRARARAWRTAFGHDADVFYAGKAFLSRAIVRWLHEEGLNLDVCSGGELATALSAGMPADRIAFHGNNKSTDEITQAIESRCRADRSRLVPGDRARRPHRAVARYAAARADPVTVGVEAHTHEFIATAHEDQKFGIALADGQAAEAVRRALAARRARTDRHPLPHRVADLRHGRASRSPPAVSSACSPPSVTSTASSFPRSTSAAASASPTPATTTRASRTRSPRRSVRSSRASARPPVCGPPYLRRARARHRRADRLHPLRGRHHQAPRRAAHVRLRRRRHVRQHPHRAVRRRVQRRSRLPASDAEPMLVPASSASTARAATSS